MPVERRGPTANMQLSKKSEPLEEIPRLRKKPPLFEMEAQLKGQVREPLANACDDAIAGKPCTGNLYARFDEGGGGFNRRPLLYWLKNEVAKFTIGGFLVWCFLGIF